MTYLSACDSPLGQILLAAKEHAICGLWLEGQLGFSALRGDLQYAETELLSEAKRWLSVYFSGNNPSFSLPVSPEGSPFRQRVWALLQEIPYGQTVTYGQLAKRLEQERNGKRVSAQAIGNAVGHNPISLLIPCHRVIGAGGNLTGYAGGLDKKIFLLKLEQAWKGSFFIPKENEKRR